MTTAFATIESPLTETMETFFQTKTSGDIAATMSWFSPNLATYTDATLGWDVDSFEALQNFNRRRIVDALIRRQTFICHRKFVSLVAVVFFVKSASALQRIDTAPGL